MTRPEVALILDLTVPQVRKIEEKALRKLRKRLEAKGITKEQVISALEPDQRSPALPTSIARVLKAAMKVDK